MTLFWPLSANQLQNSSLYSVSGILFSQNTKDYILRQPIPFGVIE